MIGALWIFRGPIFWGNFAVVDPGRVYRSAQPGEELEATIETYRLATILNLRAGSFGDRFYRREVQACERLGLDFYDLPLSATRRPSRRELLRLIDLLEHCRYPLLIHCKSGADRTGLVSALYRMVRLGIGPEEALGEFSLANGHVPLFGPEKLHEPFHEYADWLRRQGQPHTPERFREWVAGVYRDGEATLDPDALPPLPTGPRYRYQYAAQPARAGSQAQEARRLGRDREGVAGDEPASSRVSTTSEATIHSSGTSRR